MNRRRHPRLEIDIPATLAVDGQVDSGCRLLNFSLGGAYLRCVDNRLRGVLADGFFANHERRDALLTVPSESLSIRVNVVYFHNGGLGLAFRDPAGTRLFEQLYARLPASGNGRPAESSAPNLAPSQSRKLLEQIRERTQAYLQTVLPHFFELAYQSLQLRIRESSDSEEESALFFALNCLEQDRQTLSRRLYAMSRQAFAELQGEPAASVTQEEEAEALALVEKRDIDAWILVNDAARKAESQVGRSLYQLERALSYLCQSNIHNELNPISPISLLMMLKSVLDGYDLDIKSFRLVVAAFGSSLLNGLDGLYSELVEILSQAGIGQPENPLRPQWAVVTSPPRVIRESGPIEHLVTLANRHPSTAGGAALTPELSAAERDAVLASLISLSRLQGAGLPQLIERLLAQEAAQPVKLSPEARSAIGAGEELVAQLARDPLVTPELHALLDALKFLVIEAVLQDTGLLDNPQHAVRRLLDSIESLKPYVNTGPSKTLIHVREADRLAAVTEAVAAGRIDHVDQVTQEMQTLLSEHRLRFEKNRRLAISRCLKDEKRRQARHKTHQVLSQRLLGRRVPLAVDRLLRLGWATLLMQTVLHNGERGRDWPAYLQVVEWLAGGDSAVSPARLSQRERQLLLQTLRLGFNAYPVHSKGARRFLKELEPVLSGEGDETGEFSERTVTIDADYLQSWFREPRAAQTTQPADPEHAVWRRQLEELALDTWLLEQQGSEGQRVLSLAWKNPATQRYLLVDGNGFKVFDEALSQLAERFARHRIAPLCLPEKPVVERAIETILSTTYDGYMQESSTDSLTGLMNRRAFETVLRRCLSAPDRADTQVLLLIDLDKFQVANDLCGLEGGDRLLQTVTDILVGYLPEQAFLARSGDDEFSLLLNGQDLEQGFHTAESLRQAIDEYPFEWEGRMIPSSASVGVVQFEAAGQSPGELMQASLAACNMAKQGGGNCTRIYLADDSAYQDQHNLVQSLPALKEALARGRMELFVQPIVPLHDGEGMSPHYEILLRIRNAVGGLEAPQEFVRAAEQYDMMRAVDRWVVEAFFDLIEPYAEGLPPSYRFSINLSAQSLGDGEFKHFLTERINASRLPNRHLGFEITETALVGDVSYTAASIEEIRRLGCTFSLDDFGSGYASFSYLRDFPVDYVKIDGIFVREILSKPADYAMVNSITEIAHFMDKRVIAEYVSEEQIGQVLQSMGVDYGQGYHFGKPSPLKLLLAELAGGSAA